MPFTLVSMKKYIRDNKGFSLIEVLVAAAIMGGLSLLLMRFMQLESKINKTANINSSLSQISGLVSTILSNKSLCTANLHNTSPGMEVNMSNPSDAFIIDAGLNSQSSILSLGQSFGSTGIIPSKVKFELTETQTEGSATPARVIITFDKESGTKRTTLGGKQISRSFYILGHFCDDSFYNATLTNGSESEAEAYCESMHPSSGAYVDYIKATATSGQYQVGCFYNCTPSTPLSRCE